MVLVIVGYLIAPQIRGSEIPGFQFAGCYVGLYFRLFVKKAPANGGVAAMVASPSIYGTLYFAFNDLAFLNRTVITLILILISQ